jgi:hypothetical protein
MAIRVMFRMHLGLPFRQASHDEKLKVRDGLGEVFKKWNESGIKLVALTCRGGRGILTGEPT